MKGILILAHGSRDKGTENTFKIITDMVKAELPEVIVETACLQFSENGLQKGLDRIVNRGVDDITVIPYFLFSGVHIMKGIPQDIERYLAHNPGVRVTLGRALGEDIRLAQILEDRIREALNL